MTKNMLNWSFPELTRKESRTIRSRMEQADGEGAWGVLLDIARDAMKNSGREAWGIIGQVLAIYCDATNKPGPHDLAAYMARIKAEAFATKRIDPPTPAK